MSEPEHDPMKALRDANPHPTEPLPPDVSARLWARIQEDTMDTHASRRWLVALAAVPIAGVMIALALVLGSAPASGGPSTALGDGSAACIEVYTPATLGNRDFAFDGTVTGIDSGTDELGVRVTFDVNRLYIGELGSSVTLTATGVGPDSEGGPGLNVGDRLLISGDEDFMWTCGFSRTWSADMAAEWESATR